MTTWEYLTISRMLSVMELSDLGADGWDLAAVAEHNNREYNGVRFYFRRPVEPKPTDE